MDRKEYKLKYVQLTDLMLNFIQVFEGITLQMEKEPDMIGKLIENMKHRCVETERTLKIFKGKIDEQ